MCETFILYQLIITDIECILNVQDDDEGTDNDSMNDNDFDYNEEDAEDPLLGRTKVMVRTLNHFIYLFF